MIQLPVSVVPEVRSHLSQDGVTSVKFMQDGRKPVELGSLANHVTEVTNEVGFVCKKCELGFPEAHYLNNHQKKLCYPSDSFLERGTIKLIQVTLACKVCTIDEPLRTLDEFSNHCDSDIHKREIRQHSMFNSVKENDVEDVVRKITALAQARVTLDATDSNANIPKRPRLDLMGEATTAASGH